MDKTAAEWQGLSPHTRCDVLFRWLGDFSLTAPHSTLNDLTSGVAIAEALSHIDPAFFSPDWVSQITREVSADNVPLKRRNIKKIVNKIKEGFMERFNFQLVGYDFPREDAVLAADELEFSKLLQMVLTFAVYCEKQEIFIDNIRKMEEFLQGAIMMAITDIQGHLEQLSYPSLNAKPGGPVGNYPNTSLQLQKAHDEERDLYLMCEELKQSLTQAREDNLRLTSEKDFLAKKLEDLDRIVGGSPQSVPQLKQKIKELEDSLDKESAAKEALTKELADIERSNRNLQKTNSRLSEDVRQLQDEVDVLREGREKMMTLEKTVSTLSHTAEEVSSLRGVVKDLKTQLDEVLKEKIRLEEDTKLVPRLQTELERLTAANKRLEKQMEEDADLNSKDRHEAKQLRMRLESLEKEKMALLVDRTELQEHLDELEAKGGLMNPHSAFGGTTTDPDTLEIIPMVVREKMLRLDHEVKQKSARVAALEAQVQQMALESKPPARTNEGGTDEEEVEELRNRVAYLEELGDKKTLEIQEMEERYKKYLEKAKVIIRSLDPKHSPGGAGMAAGSGSASGAASLNELNSLRVQLAQKDKTIMALEEEMTALKATKEMEERLMTTAFYNLGMQLDRQASERRMAAETGAGGQVPASLLARHRNSFRRRVPGAPTGPNLGPYVGGGGSGGGPASASGVGVGVPLGMTMANSMGNKQHNAPSSG